MTRTELDKAISVVKKLHKELESFKDISEFLDVSLTDVIYLLLADRESQWDRFKDRDIKILKYVPNN